MNRKAIIKSWVIAGVLLAFIVAILIFSSVSSRQNIKDRYLLGENLKLDLTAYQNYVLKVNTPSNSFIQKDKKESMLIKLKETGKYKIVIDSIEQEIYEFEVVESFEINESDLGIQEDYSLLNVEEEIVLNKTFESNNLKIELIGEDSSEFIDNDSIKYDLGVVSINLNKTRAVRPGIYNLKVYSGKESYVEEFAYGLVSINTKKSIYRLGEKVEFELIVLDENGAGVCDAKIKATVSDPNGGKFVLNRKKGISQIECGLYKASYDSNVEGEYIIRAISEVNNRKLGFKTNFLVSDNISYEIVREAESKIDPTRNSSFFVRINITSLIGDQNLIIKEYVPSVFNVTTNGKIEDDQNQKTLTWNVSGNSAYIEYNYSVPSIWPYLYELGPLEVNGYTEYRPWYVAVDPAILVSNRPSRDISLTGLDNRTFVVAWINNTPSLNFQVFDTNGTSLTNPLQITTSLDIDSRVSVSAINRTNFIIGWDDGDSGSEDGSASFFFRNGSTWINQFEFEAGIGTTGPDIDIIQHLDRYHVCYTDATEADADIRTYLYSAMTTLSGTETNLDQNANPDTSLHNLFRCAPINSTRFVGFWFDDGVDTASFSIRDQDRVSIIAQTNIESIGATGQVAVAAMNNASFVMLYYNSTTQRVRYSIRDVNNNVILAPATLDNLVGSETRVAATTVRNQSTSSDWAVLAWADLNDNQINASVINSSGSILYTYALATNQNTSAEGLLFDVYGIDSMSTVGVCEGTYVFAYTNNTGGLVAKTLNLDGSESTGLCDYTSPSVIIRSPANITYASASRLFNITVNENISRALYSINNGGTNLSMSSVNQYDYNATNQSMLDGVYTVRFFVNDTSRNMNYSENITFSIDTTAPVITIVKPEYFGINYSASFVDFNITVDATAFMCQYSLNNGGTNLSMSTTNNLAYNATNVSIADGQYVVNYYCNDSVNNLGVINRTFGVDRIPPNLTIVFPVINNYSYSTLELNFSVRDSNSGVRMCQYSLNNGATNTTIANCQNTTFVANEGQNLLNVYANDSAGNLNNTGNVSFFVDTIFPEINYTSPTYHNESVIIDGFFRVNVTLTEINFANITYYLFNNTGMQNKTTYSTAVSGILWENLSKNFYNYTYYVEVYDVANNRNRTENRTLQITPGDITPPSIQFISPASEGEYFATGFVNFSVLINENASAVWYQLNGSSTNYTMLTENNTNFNASNTSITDGIYEIFVFANDTANNIANKSRNFTVDSTKPLIVFGTQTEIDYYNISRNWIFVNVSITEPNFANITFELYNSTTLVNRTIYNTTVFYVNWTNLNDENYRYNVSVRDLANSYNSTSTRNLRLDRTSPYLFLLSPPNASMHNKRLINLTMNGTDNLGLANLTLVVFNSSGDLINETSISNYNLQAQINISYNFSDGNFSWGYRATDIAGNYNYSSNWSLSVDASIPYIAFNNGTSNNNSQLEQQFIRVNVSVIEPNFANITFELYNSTALVNRTSNISIMTEFNFTNLNSNNITYYYNVSVFDSYNNINFTETREIKLIDITPPSLSLIEPENRTYFDNQSLLLNFSVGDINLANCWYNINLGTNVLIPGCQATEFNVSEGSNTLYLYANDTLGLLTISQITFTANSSARTSRPGLLVYANASAPSLRYRSWTGSSFSGQYNTSNVSGLIEWVSVASAPTRSENIVVSSNNSNDVVVQVNNSLNEVNCWHNGTACDRTWQLPSKSTTIDRKKFDIAYETKNGNALVVWSQANITPAYVIWNGSAFGNVNAVPQTLLLTGDISYLNMQSHPYSNEIALIMTNTTSLSAIVWNGSAWGCEPTSVITNTLTPEVYQHADLAYEQLSGDLFIANTANGLTEINFTTKQNGTCTYINNRTTNMVEEGEQISVGAQYGSDFIMISQVDIGGNDMESIPWNGTNLTALSGNEASLLASVSPNILIAPTWAGRSDFGLAVYSDTSPSLNLDYFRYNKSTNAWMGGTTGVDASGITNFGNEERNIISQSYIDQNKSIIIVMDEDNDLWAKTYNANTNTWSDNDGGVALETGLPSTPRSPFGFSFNYDFAGPQIQILSPLNYINNASIIINASLKESGTACSYLLDVTPGQMNIVNSLSFYANRTTTEGVHSLEVSCTDVWENSNTKQSSFIVDLSNPGVNFSIQTLNNNTFIEQNFIFVNVSVSEANEANITFTLANTTGIVNITTYSSGNRSINWTGIIDGIYYYNVSVSDLAGRRNTTETRTLNINFDVPRINLTSPINYQNVSGYNVYFNFSVSDNSSIRNCSLYGNWTGNWHLNQTILDVQKNVVINFSTVTSRGDGTYVWNVLCIDEYYLSAFNNTNFTFSTFTFPHAPILLSINQTSNQGRGNVTLFWTNASHNVDFVVDYTTNYSAGFVNINYTQLLNYTDSNFSNSTRRIYRIGAVNPVGINYSAEYFSAHVYTLSHTSNTKNLIGWPTNVSYLSTASLALNDITNATAFNDWNSTIQRRVTCNKFLCPNVPSCTDTSCNFIVRSGKAYEVNINSSAPNSVNWSAVGKLYPKVNVSLNKNDTSFAKNWVSVSFDTNLTNAQTLIRNISFADAVSIWDAVAQTSKGLIQNPLGFGPTYIGNNFEIFLERGYEVSVNRSTNWTQG